VSALEIIAIVAAGLAAGTINTLVGSGTLITFPVLLAFGFPPVTANVSNNIGLVPGSLSGVVGYRRELVGQRSRILRFGPMSALGSATGAVALLVLPPGAFKAIVPFFIVLALVLIVIQPRLGPKLIAMRAEGRTAEHPGWLRPAVLSAGVYGGYFGAAQGIMLIAMLGLALPEDLQRVNALKNVLSTTVNLTAGIVFVFAAHVDWQVAGLIAIGSTAGGQLGSRYGRGLPPDVLRAIIVVVGVSAIVRLILS
jgi:uncharacterized membrane protein YfcA